MARKNFSQKLSATVASQDKDLEERLSKADKLFAAPSDIKISTDTPVKAAKANVVRDTYSMPQDEFDVIDMLRGNAAKHGQFVSKSEILRAGLLALSDMNEAELGEALARVQRLKPGRKPQ